MSINPNTTFFKDINHVHCHSHNRHSQAFILIVFLVLVQISYVVLDLVEAKTDNSDYGVAAGFMMSTFGLFILGISIYTWIQNRQLSRDVVFEFIEGFIYISLGIAITIIRWGKNCVDE